MYQGKRILLCGVGAEAVVLALAGADVYGIDRSSTRVEAVKDQARRLGLRDRTHLQTANMQQLPYPDNFFDLVLGKSSVQQDGSLGAGGKELVRVMKPGGRVVFGLD